MRFYKFMAKGIFVRALEMEGNVGGFYATFFVKSSNVASATDRMRQALFGRMSAHSVETIDAGIFRTYFSVSDVWEVTEESIIELEGRDLGFTFFRISKTEFTYLALMRALPGVFRPRTIFFSNRNEVTL